MPRDRPRMDRCCLCDGDLADAARYPDIQYCQVCAGNIPVLHKGHQFEFQQPNGSGHADESSQPDYEIRRPPQCHVCQELLYDLRFSMTYGTSVEIALHERLLRLSQVPPRSYPEGYHVPMTLIPMSTRKLRGC